MKNLSDWYFAIMTFVVTIYIKMYQMCYPWFSFKCNENGDLTFSIVYGKPLNLIWRIKWSLNMLIHWRKNFIFFFLQLRAIILLMTCGNNEQCMIRYHRSVSILCWWVTQCVLCRNRENGKSVDNLVINNNSLTIIWKTSVSIRPCGRLYFW